MKIAVATKKNWTRVSGHAGQTKSWLIFDCQPGQPQPEPARIVLSRMQLPHYCKDDGPHPLRGVSTLVTASAGEGYFRHAATWGAKVILTGESDPIEVVRKILAGEALAEPRFDITTSLCKVIDLFSSH
jgi:predicted Fe-Mo cluster-binding NifX family protein